MKLLLVLPMLPWPTRQNGLTMRFAPLIEHFAKSHQVEVLVANPAGTDPREVQVPPDFPCPFSILDAAPRPMNGLVRKLRTLLTVLSPWGLPYGWVTDIAPRDIAAAVARKAREGKYDAVWYVGHCIGVIEPLRREYRGRLVLDLVDSPTLTLERKAVTEGWNGLMARYTSWKCRRFERSSRRLCDIVVYISKVDAAVAGDGNMQKVRVIANGVFLGDAPREFPDRARRGSSVVGFLGNMSYQPNVEAAQRLAGDILPRMRRAHPEVRMLVIGRDPKPEVEALANDYVEVTGTIPDIWSAIDRTDVFVFPMISGAGLQNKILDAMLGEVPVVSSSLAANSVGAHFGDEILVADEDEALAQAALQMLTDRARAREVALAAKRFLMRVYAWDAICAQYEDVISGKPGHG